MRLVVLFQHISFVSSKLEDCHMQRVGKIPINSIHGLYLISSEGNTMNTRTVLCESLGIVALPEHQ